MGREEIFEELVRKVKAGKLDEIEALGFKRTGEAEWEGYGLRVRVKSVDGFTVLELRKASGRA